MLFNVTLDVAADVIAIIFRTYLADQSIDHLASALKKSGVKDLLLFFPPNKRQDKVLDEHFRKAGIPQVADWWTKKKFAILKEGIIRAVQGSIEGDSSAEVSLVYPDLRSAILTSSMLGCRRSSQRQAR